MTGAPVEQRSVDIVLTGGNDGDVPTVAEYEGEDPIDDDSKTGLVAFEDIEDISIVAAPGSTCDYETSDRERRAHAIVNALIAPRAQDALPDRGARLAATTRRSPRCAAMRAQVRLQVRRALLPVGHDPGPDHRASEIYLPPSGFVAGIYARNDVDRARLQGAGQRGRQPRARLRDARSTRPSRRCSTPRGSTASASSRAAAIRLWGARTMSSDPEWKYVNLRRYFAYLERSIDSGTQWAVFEPNGERLWANVRRTIEDFLLNEWQSGALLGDKPEKAYFVRCDRSTMTQNDLDNGRLVCLIGVAPLRPAEFVIFRIGQWTADREGLERTAKGDDDGSPARPTVRPVQLPGRPGHRQHRRARRPASRSAAASAWR